MNTSTHKNLPVNTTRQSGRYPRLRKAMRMLLLSAAGILVLCTALLAAATWWLSGDNLSRLLSKYGSRYLSADVSAANVDFTIWSSFPHFRITIDSLCVVSRTLRGQPEDIRRQLPANSDSLLCVEKLSGGVNVLRLLTGSVHLGDMTATGLRLNAVAFNDSINNFDIVPSATGLKHPPYITARSIRLINTREITYFSAATHTRASASFDRAELLRSKSDRNLYALLINGHFSARVRNLQLFDAFPFNFRGAMMLSFHPLAIRFPDYNISLANVHTQLNMDIDFSKEPQISSLHTRTNPFRLMQLIQYLPRTLMPQLQRIKSDMTVCASVKLTKPWKLSSTSLPSFVINFSVPSSRLSYTLADHPPMRLHDVGLDARLTFDGDSVERSYLDVARLSFAAPGLGFTLNGRITNLLGNPHISLHARGDADCRRLASIFPALSPYRLSGTAHADTRMRFNVSANPGMRLEDVALDGLVHMRGISLSSGSATIRNPLATLRFSSAVASASAADLQNADMNISLDSDSMLITSPEGSLSLFGVSLRSIDSSLCFGDKPTYNHNDTLPLQFSVIRATARAPGLESPAVASDISGVVAIRPFAGSSLPAFTASAGIYSIHWATRRGNADIRNMHLAVNARQISCGAAGNIHYRAVPDSITSGPHTPPWLSVNVPASLRTLLADWQIRASLKADSGSYLHPAYPAPTLFRNLDASLSSDSLHLHSLAVRSQSTAMRMSGQVSNLHDFLLRGGTSPLRLRFDLALDTIDINQLAHTYEKGEAMRFMAASGGRLSQAEADSLTRIVKMPAEVSGSDTTTLLIPRNIDARLRITARATRYTNLNLYDLGTSVRIADGRANVDSLYVSSSFGKAFMSMDVDTRRVQDYHIGASLDIVQIDVVKFFKKFNALLRMAPYMSNLSGFVSAKADFSMQAFPDMNLNIPSVLANVSMKGYDLKVHQSKFIRHITRMMLIGTDADIHIPTITVNATVHDNLLELYPFRIIFNRYEAVMEGMNDFQGNLYYHIGLEKSPIPFRYAINIIGTYAHPKLRFGGFRYKPDQAMRLNSIMKPNRINIVKEAKYYLRKFVRNASEAANSTPSAN